jgi:hypothetical protein
LCCHRAFIHLFFPETNPSSKPFLGLGISLWRVRVRFTNIIAHAQSVVH